MRKLPPSPNNTDRQSPQLPLTPPPDAFRHEVEHIAEHEHEEEEDRDEVGSGASSPKRTLSPSARLLRNNSANPRLSSRFRLVTRQCNCARCCSSANPEQLGEVTFGNATTSNGAGGAGGAGAGGGQGAEGGGGGNQGNNNNHLHQQHPHHHSSHQLHHQQHHMEYHDAGHLPSE